MKFTFVLWSVVCQLGEMLAPPGWATGSGSARQDGRLGRGRHGRRVAILGGMVSPGSLWPGVIESECYVPHFDVRAYSDSEIFKPLAVGALRIHLGYFTDSRFNDGFGRVVVFVPAALWGFWGVAGEVLSCHARVVSRVLGSSFVH